MNSGFRYMGSDGKGESGLRLPYFVTILWYEPLEGMYSW